MTENDSLGARLSIVVPVLNERDELPGLLDNLARQKDVDYEVLISDGGSTDGSVAWLERRRAADRALRLIEGPPGRGGQLNRGIAAARHDWLLLLHVDSRFDDPLALKNALEYMSGLPSLKVAGHFALRFRRERAEADAAYYFYEWKARLGFVETIHGDQGFILHRQLADRVGCFDTLLPAMEDTDFSDRLRRVGQWHLLAQDISTSARRFEVEGLWQRQLLGALIMCFRVIGWSEFFQAAPDVYRRQDKTKKLKVLPFFRLIGRLMAQKDLSERWRLWYAAGTYVRPHAWQLFLAVDARRAFRAGCPVGRGRTPWLDFLMPIYDFATDNGVGRIGATLLLRLWFSLTLLILTRREKSGVDF